MTLTIFIILMFVLAITDYLHWHIPNLIVLPAIIIGCFLTDNWLWALVTFILASGLYKKRFWRGGDVKLITMVASFLGLVALPIFGATWSLIKLFRIVGDNYQPLPVAPFMFLATIWTIGLLQLCRMTTP
jgi:Flp pilus assembly protein protease CpaA